MNLHKVFENNYYQKLVFEPDAAKVYGLEIWSLESAQPETRNIPLSADNVDAWLNQQGSFTEPDRVRRKKVHGRLKLLYLHWAPREDGSQTRSLPFSIPVWKSIMSALRLPSSYALTLADRRQVAPHVIGTDKTSSSPMSFICQSPPLLDSFMTVCLSFDATSKTTTGFLGFQAIKRHATSGVLLLESIRDARSLVHDPMLIPVLLFDVWVRTLQHEQRKINRRLREVQEQTGLLHDYLRRQSTIQQGTDYDAVHQTLVQEHAYLTNGMADFVQSLASSLISCSEKTKEHFNKIATIRANPQQVQGSHNQLSQQQSQGNQRPPEYDDFDAKQYIESLLIRAEAELQQRQRMLDRIAMYLQVLYNLMQQQIANETRRDSSAMKSIALLTMVFLPATAIATVISPFITITDSNTIVMTDQFWIFWAIAGPVTVVVVAIWTSWIQRSEIATLLKRRRSKKDQEKV